MEDYEWSLAVVVLTTNSYCFSLYTALNTLNYSLHDYHISDITSNGRDNVLFISVPPQITMSGTY